MLFKNVGYNINYTGNNSEKDYMEISFSTNNVTSEYLKRIFLHNNKNINYENDIEYIFTHNLMIYKINVNYISDLEKEIYRSYNRTDSVQE